MSKIKKDKLEEFFESRIKQQTGAEDWNLPSNDIFLAAIEKVVIQKEENKRKWLILSSIAFFTLVLSILLYISNRSQQVNPAIATTETPNIIEKSESGSQQTIQKINTSTANQNIEEKVKIAPVKFQAATTIANTKSTLRKPAVGKSKILQSQNPVFPDATQFAPDNISNEIKSNINIQQANVLAPYSDDRNPALTKRTKIETIKLLANNKLSGIETNALNLPIANFAYLENSSASCCNSKPIRLFAQSSLLQSSVFMKDVHASDFTLEGYERFSMGYSFGFGLEKDLSNKFSLRANTNLIHFSNSSVYESKFNFDETHAFIADNGDQMYHNKMVLNTPRARISMSDDVFMADKMNQDDLITNTTEIVESYWVAQLGIGLHYALYSTSRLSLDLGLTPGINYIFNDHTELSTVLEAHNMQMASYNSTENSMDVGAFNQLYFDVNSSLSLNYHFTNNWTLRLSGLYGHSLNSIKKFDDLDSSKSYFKTRSVAVGLAYQF